MAAETKLEALQRERANVQGFIYRAQARLADLNEQIRLQGGNSPADFSGAVRRLKESGVLPNPQRK